MMLGRRNARFTIMAVGGKGSGKSSFFNNLVSRLIIKNKKQSEIDLYMLNLDGLGASQNIVFIDTPGFGKTLNDDHIQTSISEYIKEQFDLFIEEESKIRRNSKYEDTRIHCLVYFIPATGNGLKVRDIAFLKKVTGLVNIIPVISKADALTTKEAKAMMELINEQLKINGIEVFNFEHEDYVRLSENNQSISDKIPFTLICADNFSGSSKVRRHPGGDIEVDDANNSSLPILREFLLGSHLEILIETTANEIYEKYRADVLESAINQK